MLHFKSIFTIAAVATVAQLSVSNPVLAFGSWPDQEGRHSVPEERKCNGTGDLYADAQNEVLAVMTFLEKWWQGRLEKTEDNYRLNRVLMPEFTFVTPEGLTLDQETTIPALYASHGTRKNLRQIEDLNFSVIARSGNLIVLSYDEYHRYADGRTDLLVTTSVLARDCSAPLGVKWVRVQETLKQ